MTRAGIRPRKATSRHGATQPEEERERQQAKLRLAPDDIERLAELARRSEVTRSELVAYWIARAWAARET